GRADRAGRPDTIALARARGARTRADKAPRRARRAAALPSACSFGSTTDRGAPRAPAIRPDTALRRRAASCAFTHGPLRDAEHSPRDIGAPPAAGAADRSGQRRKLVEPLAG